MRCNLEANEAAARRMQEQEAAGCSVFMPEQTSGILPEQDLQANLANSREL